MRPFLLLSCCVAAAAWAIRPAAAKSHESPEIPAALALPGACAEGLQLAYGFDHEAASAAFTRALEADPDCAMAHWGLALAAGPNINNPVMEEEASKLAFEESRKALARVESVAPLESALIHALATRYAWPAPADRHELDAAYANAMRGVWEAHPDQPDVGALYAEAMMDLRPWDLWTADGEPQPGTHAIVTVLERVLAVAPEHRGANHYYIHTMEASSEPARALPAADRLRKLSEPTSHLVHMPGHIDMRVGHYLDALLANERAVEIDRARVAEGHGLGFYTLYRAHNLQFLAWAGMFLGRREESVSAIREMARTVPDELVAAYPDFLEGYLGAPYCVLVRFGMWDEILAEPEPPAGRPASAAFRRYARAIALSTNGETAKAAAEQRAFVDAVRAVPETATLGNNPVRTVLGVAEEMIAGELAYRRGEYDAAFAHLRTAIEREDGLRYDEPWGWMQPVRHALGALLLEQDRVQEAEAVYREDLRRHPENGWSLHGLAECLRRTGRDAEADEVHRHFETAWSHADIPLSASCFCRTGAVTAGR